MYSHFNKKADRTSKTIFNDKSDIERKLKPITTISLIYSFLHSEWKSKSLWQNSEKRLLQNHFMSLWVSSSLWFFVNLNHSVQGIIMHDIAKIFHCNEQQKRLAKRDFLGHPIELKRDSLLQLLTKYFRWQNQYCVGHLRLACSMKCEESRENKCQLFDCDFEHSSYFCKQ